LKVGRRGKLLTSSRATALGVLVSGLVTVPAPAVGQTAVATYDSLCNASSVAVDLGEFNADRHQRDSLFSAAEKDARAAVAANPQGVQGHFALARALGRRALSLGVRERAKYGVEVREEAIAALVIDPRHAGALHVLGVWNHQVMQLSALQRLVAKTILGARVFGKASWQEAVSSLEDAVAIEPDRIVHRLDLARVYIARKRNAEARDLLLWIGAAPVSDYNDPHYKREAEAILGLLAREPGA